MIGRGRAPAGRHHRGRVVLLDDQRAGDAAGGAQGGTAGHGRGQPAVAGTEIDAAVGRRARRSRGGQVDAGAEVVRRPVPVRDAASDHPQAHDLHRLLDAVAVGAPVLARERRLDRRQRRGAEPLDRQVDGQLRGLSLVLGVDLDLQPLPGVVEPLAGQQRPALAADAVEDRVGPLRVQRGQRLAVALHEVMLDVREQQPEGAEHARRRRDDHAPDAERGGQPGRVHGTAAAEGDHREAPRVAPALAGDRAQRPAHLHVGEGVHAPGRLGLGEAGRLRQPLAHRRVRPLGIDREGAAEQVLGIQEAQCHVGVGDGRFGAARAVADRARHRAGGVRADLQTPGAVHPGDAAAAGGHLGDVDGRHAQHVAGAAQQAVTGVHAAADLVLGRQQHLAALDDGRLGGGAAHVEADQIGLAEAGAHLGRADHAGGRPRLDAVHGLARGQLDRHQAAVGLHHGHRSVRAGAAQLGDQPLQVALHHRPDVAVDDGGAGALVLAGFRQQLAGQGDVHLGQRGAKRLAYLLLVPGVGVGVQQGDRHGGDARLPDRGHRPLHVTGVERREHPAARIDALAHLQAQAPLHQRRRLAVGQVVEPRRAQPGDLQHVAEPLGGDQRHRRALAFQDGVGGDREAVHDLGHAGGRQVQLGQRVREAAQHAPAVVVRRARHLDHGGPAGVGQGDDVGKGSADVDADAALRSCLSRRHLWALLSHCSNRSAAERIGRWDRC